MKLETMSVHLFLQDDLFRDSKQKTYPPVCKTIAANLLALQSSILIFPEAIILDFILYFVVNFQETDPVVNLKDKLKNNCLAQHLENGVKRMTKQPYDLALYFHSVTGMYTFISCHFHFQSCREGDPSTKVVFQGALHLKIQYHKNKYLKRKLKLICL